MSTGGGDVYWAVNGAAPNRELVIEWRKMGYNGCATDGSEAVTFQAVLFESRPDVLFNYADTSFGGTCTAHDRGASASIGVQTTTAVGKQSSLNTGAVQDSTAVSWTATLPSNTPPTITSLNPKSWYTDVFDTYIEVIGTKFTPQSVLLVNGSPRSTSVYNQGDAFAVLTAADIAKVGTLQLSMFNGLPNGGPSTPVSYTIAGDDFTLATSSSSMTVRLGQSNNITVYANPNPVYNDGISLSCSGLPVNATCTFDPARILPLGYSVMTITAKTSAAQPATPTASHRRLSPWGFATVGFVAAFAGVRSRKRALAVLILAAFFSFAYIGCGGGGGSTSHSAATTTTTTPTNPTVTPSSTTGTFNVTITATSGSLTRTKIITVTLSQ